MSKVLLFICLLFCFNNAIAQQAWNQDKGGLYAQTCLSFFNFGSKYNDLGEAELIPRPVSQKIIALYAEYGFNEKLTIGLNLPYHLTRSKNLNPNWEGINTEKGKLNALGNASIWGQYQLYKKNSIVFAAKLLYRINSSTSEINTGLSSGFNAQSISPSLLFGLAKESFFTSAELAYSLQNNGYLNRVNFSAQIGAEIPPAKKLIAIFGISTSSAFGNAPSNFDGNRQFTALYQNEQAFVTASIKLGYKITPHMYIWVSNGFGSAQNTGQSAVTSISIAYKN